MWLRLLHLALANLSKPVRIPDRLYDQIKELAHSERRSTANMTRVLLEQALEIHRTSDDWTATVIGITPSGPIDPDAPVVHASVKP